ncbi:MAG: hypothetical protein IJ751_10735 [Oscillospiraceae bacterium]|nr:hypothetical protein [Oscillospiraceae bacterium]
MELIDRMKKIGFSQLCVYCYQICTLLPLPYILVAPGYMGLLTHRNLLSVLFDVGMAALPRAETLALSLLYRHTASERAVYFTMLTAALLLGLLLGRLLRAAPKTAEITQRALAGLLGADLLLRVLPFPCNLAFGWAASALGFAVEALCLALLVTDLRGARRSAAG